MSCIIYTQKKMKPNWDKIRREFFNECTDEVNGLKKINLSPHNLFEWFHQKLTSKKRSLSLNAAFHLWLTQIAEVLNDAGHTYTNEMGIPCIYTMHLLKETYWKPLQKQLFDIESTTQMTSTILNNLIDSFTLWLSENKGVIAPRFPDLRGYLLKLDSKNN